MEADGSTAGSNDESVDGDDKRSEFFPIGSQGVPTEHATEAGLAGEGDRSLFDGSGNVAVLNLEEVDV